LCCVLPLPQIDGTLRVYNWDNSAQDIYFNSEEKK